VTSFGSITLNWLLAIPISEGERQLLLKQGDVAFKQQLEIASINIFDLDRLPIV
jgi:hypothetical protein